MTTPAVNGTGEQVQTAIQASPNPYNLIHSLIHDVCIWSRRHVVQPTEL